MQHPLLTKPVKEFMTEKVIVVKPTDTVFHTSKLMAKHDISCVVVVKNGKPIGVISERDTNRKVVAASKNSKEMLAKDVMSRPIYTVDYDCDLTDVLKKMRDKRVRRLIIMDGKDNVKGIVTQTDVANTLYWMLISKLNEVRHIYSRTQELFKDSVKALFQALDAKDHYTGAHSREVARLAYAIANKMGMTEEKMRNVYLAGLFHDIGKIHISDEILNKPGALTKEEFQEMKLHPIMSEMILKPITEFRNVLPTIRHHHEWYNGKGYPDGKSGTHIPVEARVLQVADCYNAMTTDRPYRKAMSPQKAIGIIKEMSGKQFDPKIVKVFSEMSQKDFLPI